MSTFADADPRDKYPNLGEQASMGISWMFVAVHAPHMLTSEEGVVYTGLHEWAVPTGQLISYGHILCGNYNIT